MSSRHRIDGLTDTFENVGELIDRRCCQGETERVRCVIGRGEGLGGSHAVVELDADVALHGNQQGTVHGGMLVELAGAAIGTAQSTVMEPASRSPASISGRRSSGPCGTNALACDGSPTRGDGKPVATVTSVVMTLRGDQAQGR